jgi:hypothetical protein
MDDNYILSGILLQFNEVLPTETIAPIFREQRLFGHRQKLVVIFATNFAECMAIYCSR